MTKTEFLNDLIYDMAGYLDTSGVDRLKNAVAYRLKGFQLTSDETLPATDVRDNEWILGRYHVDLIAVGRKEKTIGMYLYTLRKFFNETGLHYASMTGQDIMDYIAIRQYRDKISKAYAGNIQKCLSAFAKWAYRKHHIEKDIYWDIDKIKIPQKMKKRLSDYEVSKCRNSLKTLREKALLELMLSAGPRVGEICNLKIENLDFERGEINIYGEKTSKWRVCFMTPDCRVALEQYINGRTEGYIFLNSRNEVTGKQLCKATIEEIAKEIAERAGCKCVATVHVYRKTFASREYARTIEQWKDINKNGCNDPFWSDGCNMNLTRNHIIYAQEQIRKICKENNIPFPEECYLSVPPKADINYMAHLKQKERVEWIFHCGGLPVKMKYEYEEQQLSLF